jgi:hypothetical protein
MSEPTPVGKPSEEEAADTLEELEEDHDALEEELGELEGGAAEETPEFPRPDFPREQVGATG